MSVSTRAPLPLAVLALTSRVVLILGLAVGGLSAQSSTAPNQVSLDQVEALTAEGRIMAARNALEIWLELMEPSASRTDQQRAIWLRGRLTVDPSMAEADFRRLVLEYPGGAYSDDALWRLGLSAATRGDSSQARDFFSSLARDYPTSPLAPEAAERARTYGAEDATFSAVPSPEEVAGAFAVQLGAFQNLDLARGLAEKLETVGQDPRLVRTPGDALNRVRIGRFASKEEAEACARELRAQGFDVTVVSDATRETRISFQRS